MNDVAIVHDQWLPPRGGAERVAIEMAREFDAPIYVSCADEEVIPDDVEVVEAFDGRLVSRMLRSHHLIADAAQMLAWQYVDGLYDYETIVLNKNNPGWFVPRDDQAVIKYCHSTPRNTYDRFHENRKPLLARAVGTAQRVLYWPNLAYPDRWIANSDLVARRIQRYWDQGRVDVVYPPVPVRNYGPDLGDGDRGDHYFTISRLYGHKAIESIVRAFDLLNRDDCRDYRLVVAGDGPKRAELERMAPPNVEFLGHVSEGEKRRLYANAKATIFAARNEDFGLVPVESMASGTPVIGVEDGFTRHQILHGKNGLLFSRNGGHLRETIRLFERRGGVSWDSSQIQEFAEQFSAERFREEIRTAVHETEREVSRSMKPDWVLPESTKPSSTGTIVPDGSESS